ncbi:hypothetical protein AXF42_Ash003296 [Apostasia shenzhenica]|uniref:CAAX prenyl protease 2/Lysostaphin resistance protein A-like domain-containing protein n=1 Tax=Apostasia shenzhenica TaxID=1088818 RepID=A0A2I0BFS3_9ASPA|nr:hypothetical protein AXF42_Ash003296 [Apostasia shenzhenica]
MISGLHMLLRPPVVSVPTIAIFPAGRIHTFPGKGGRVLPCRFSVFSESKRIHALGIVKLRKLQFACFYDSKEKLRKDIPDKVPSPLGLLETIALPYLGFQGEEVSLDQKAEILFTGQFAVTAAVLGVLYGITNTFQPLPDDVFCYDPREPFNLQKGWLLWAGVGLFGAVISIALTDALIRLLPLIGSSTVSTVCLVVITGVLAPLLEETVFRGFLMVSLTKWLPTPVSVLLSAAVFAIAHLTLGEFPQLFVLGATLLSFFFSALNLKLAVFPCCTCPAFFLNIS